MLTNHFKRGQLAQNPPTERTIVCYTIRGKEDSIDGDSNPIVNDESSRLVYAKKIINPVSNVWRYYIRLDSQNHLYNPMSLYNEEARLRSKMKDSLPYTEVDAKVFAHYLTFLRTKNKVFYTYAERG